ncbi:hypothetical protein ACW9KT_05640 [Hymenobacter sp. HD11105]
MKAGSTFWNKLWIDIGVARLHIAWLFILLPFVYLLSVGAAKTFKQYRVATTGLTTKAFLTSQLYQGLRNNNGYYYHFKVKDKLYTGHTMNIVGYSPGDSIDIMFLKKMPEVNYDQKFLHDNY